MLSAEQQLVSQQQQAPWALTSLGQDTDPLYFQHFQAYICNLAFIASEAFGAHSDIMADHEF